LFAALVLFWAVTVAFEVLDAFEDALLGAAAPSKPLLLLDVAFDIGVLEGHEAF
jgi:hypothetical protein